MRFIPTSVQGAFIVEPERVEDERGYFARYWDRRGFEAQGLNTNLEQCNVSFNRRRGTLRGLHYQDAPEQEVKLIRCTRGAIFDVAVDLRPDSRTFLNHVDVILDAENHRMLYIPEGCAHGFQTLASDTEVAYQISREYVPQLARGVRWNDLAFGIRWPLEVTVMSERDKKYADYMLPVRHGDIRS